MTAKFEEARWSTTKPSRIPLRGLEWVCDTSVQFPELVLQGLPVEEDEPRIGFH